MFLNLTTSRDKKNVLLNTEHIKSIEMDIDTVGDEIGSVIYMDNNLYYYVTERMTEIQQMLMRCALFR